MFINSIKTFLAVGIVAAGAAVSTTSTANAGSSFGIYIGNGQGTGIHYNNRKHRNHVNNRGNGVKRQGYVQRRVCAPRRALNKAYRIGVNRPHVARINHRNIVVVGYNRGRPAKVVFKRNGHGCKIIKTRGIR